MASAAITEEVIDNLDDLDKAVELMNELNLDSDEVEEVADAKHELRRYLSRLEKVESDQAEGIHNDVYEITAANVSNLICTSLCCFHHHDDDNNCTTSTHNNSKYVNDNDNNKIVIIINMIMIIITK